MEYTGDTVRLDSANVVYEHNSSDTVRLWVEVLASGDFIGKADAYGHHYVTFTSFDTIFNAYMSILQVVKAYQDGALDIGREFNANINRALRR